MPTSRDRGKTNTCLISESMLTSMKMDLQIITSLSSCVSVFSHAVTAQVTNCMGAAWRTHLHRIV